MIGFIAGLFIGCFIGVVVMAFCNAASKADEQMERFHNDKTE